MEYDLQDYFFDLRGYLVLEQAVDPGHVAALNRALDEFPELAFEAWHGNVQRFDNHGKAGVELQNIVEAGEPFERLIDHPSWNQRLLRYCGEKDTYVEGLFLDECFASIRRSGGYFPVHSGGIEAATRNQYHFKTDGHFRCGQVNILLALTDIGPGDGGTMLIPGSHKSCIRHPLMIHDGGMGMKPMDHLPGAVEMHLKKGDALMFVDAVAHGASSRVNPGERRAVIYRFGVSWGNTRYGYRYSPELLARVTPAQRKILEPIAPRGPGK